MSLVCLLIPSKCITIARVFILRTSLLGREIIDLHFTEAKQRLSDFRRPHRSPKSAASMLTTTPSFLHRLCGRTAIQYLIWWKLEGSPTERRVNWSCQIASPETDFHSMTEAGTVNEAAVPASPVLRTGPWLWPEVTVMGDESVVWSSWFSWRCYIEVWNQS